MQILPIEMSIILPNHERWEDKIVQGPEVGLNITKENRSTKIYHNALEFVSYRYPISYSASSTQIFHLSLDIWIPFHSNGILYLTESLYTSYAIHFFN